MRFALSAVRSFGLVMAFAIVAAACSAGAGQGSNLSNATIGFVSPSDGATVSIPFNVQLEASVPLGETSTGNPHAHIYFDTDTTSTDYDILYGTTGQVTRNLAPGEHKLIVALANPDHSLAGPTQQITVTVEAGAGGSESGGASPSSSGKPLY